MSVFGDLNKAEVIGNITQDIEVRYTPNGKQVTNFSVATNRSYKMGDDWKEEVTFHNIVVWGTDADQLALRAQKGTRVYVQGRMQTRSWEGADGKKNYRTELVADSVLLLDRYTKGQVDGPVPTASDSSPKNEGKKSASKSKPKSSDEDIIDPDDLPF